MHHLMEMIFGRTHYVHPDRARMILWALRDRLGLPEGAIEQPDRQAAAFFGQPARSGMYRIENGAAIIPIIGTLTNRGGWIGANSGLVAYEALAAQVREAVDDPDVEHIVLDIDSPGGTVAGSQLLAEQIHEARQKKPVVAVVNDMAASAAYLMASQADQIVISPTSMVGSIGVLYIHADFSGQLEKEGVGITIMTAGAHKADGNPYEPLPDEVRADIQQQLDRDWELFIKAVHRGRPSLSPVAIRAMEARVYTGEAAIEAGLADRIGRLEEVLGITREEISMSEKSKQTPRAAVKAPAGDGPVMDMEQVRREALAEGRSAERERIGAILTSQEAAGREALARELALTTELTPDQAAKVLSAAPKEAAIPVQPEAASDLGLELVSATATAGKADPMDRWDTVLKKMGA